MDSRLQERLNKWSAQIDVLKEIELTWFEIEGSEEAVEAQLFLKSEGKTVEERKSRGHDNETWRSFKKTFAMLKSDYNKEKRVLDLRIKAYEAEYLQLKIEAEMIHKGRGGQL